MAMINPAGQRPTPPPSSGNFQAAGPANPARQTMKASSSGADRSEPQSVDRMEASPSASLKAPETGKGTVVDVIG